MDKETESNSLIRELKSQLRQEKIMGHFNAHKKRIFYLLLAVVLAVITWSALNFYSQAQSKKYSSILHQAMIDEQKGDLEKSTAAFKQIYQSNAPAGVKEIASLKYASSLLKENQSDQAVEAYLAVNKNKKFDAYIREYSGLIALKILVGENKKEHQEKITALVSDLEKNSKILKYYIIEQKAINQWSNANFKEANQSFKSLANNPEVSDMLKKRAAEMVAIYSSRFGDDEEKTVEKSSEKAGEKASEEASEKASENKAVEQKVETKE